MNAGQATAGDVRALMDLVMEGARREFGLELIPEVEIPEWTA